MPTSDAVTLSRLAIEDQTIQDQHVWALTIEATSSVAGLSSKIFVYHAAGPNDEFSGDTFECVASVSQLGEIPEDAPRTTENLMVVPYYRKSVLAFNCRSAAEAEDLWLKVVEDVQDLVTNFRAASALTNSGSVTIS